MWDVVVLGLTLPAVGLLLLLLATTRRRRIVGLMAVLSVAPGWLGVGWLNNVTIRGGTYCVFRGPVDSSTDCGAEFLHRYWIVAGPLAIALVLTLVLLVVELQTRLRTKTAAA